MSRLAWVVVIGIGVLVLFSLVGGLVAPLLHGRGYGYGWGMTLAPHASAGVGPGRMGGFGFPFMGMGLGMLVFWMIIIGGGVWLIQSLSRGTGSGPIPPQGESPVDIVKRRYARGEITQDQFEGMRRDLGL